MRREKICYCSQGRAEKTRQGQQLDMRQMTGSDALLERMLEVSMGTLVVSVKSLWTVER